MLLFICFHINTPIARLRTNTSFFTTPSSIRIGRFTSLTLEPSQNEKGSKFIHFLSLSCLELRLTSDKLSMKRIYKLTVAALMLGLMVVSFQNCGKPSSNFSEAQEVFVHFDELQNTDFEIVHSSCSDDTCLFTLHSLDNVNGPLGTSDKTRPGTRNALVRKGPKNSGSGQVYPSVEYDFQPNKAEVQFGGIYCDVLQQSGFGDVYVSCPQEVQNDPGFYIKL